MRLQTIVTATLLFAAGGCHGASPFGSAQEGLIGAQLRAAQGVTHYAGDPTKLMGSPTGADTIAQPGGEFDAGPDVHCVRISDEDTPHGSEHVASCNDDWLHLALTLDNENGRRRAELHLDGIFQGSNASSTTIFDLADDPLLLDGDFDEQIAIRLGPTTTDRHTRYAFQHVVLDTTGCATDGSVQADREETDQDDLSALFMVGPGCNEVHEANRW